METKTNESTTAKPAASAKPAAAKPAAAKAKPASTAAKPAAAKTKVAKAATENTQSEMAENEKVHIFEKMIDFTYIATTSIPVGGKYVKKIFDQYETKKHAKQFSHRFFEPFFPFPKFTKKS